MAWPRRIVPGATYLLTRRAYQRTYRLRPHAVTNQVVEYCLAWAARQTGVSVHACVFMSNHHHMVVTDVEGRLPEFIRELHRLIAKALNASQGQWENLWSAEPTSVVRLPATSDIVDKIAYAVANPVAAALVQRPQQWPGVIHWKPGHVVHAKRPKAYFDPNGTMPKTLSLTFVAPAQIGKEPESQQRWVTRVDDAVNRGVGKAQRHVAAQGLRFMGASAVLKKSFLKRARTYEQKRGINPILAARDIRVRVTFLRIELAFRAAYRDARLAWCNGDRTALFPFGTWWMHVHHGACVLHA